MTQMLYRKGDQEKINNQWPCDLLVVDEAEVPSHLKAGWHLSALAAHGMDDGGNPLKAKKGKPEKQPETGAGAASPDPNDRANDAGNDDAGAEGNDQTTGD